MSRIRRKIEARLAALNAEVEAEAQAEADEKAAQAKPVQAAVSTKALMRIRKGFGKGKGKRNFTLVTPTRGNARDLMAAGTVKPCPRGCGPMTEVGLHGERRGVTCLSCFVTEPLEEMHILDPEN